MKTVVSFLLDETGSMQSRKEVTISAFNEYVGTLREDHDSEYAFTLVKFNSHKTTRVCTGVAMADVPLLDDENYAPQASTPLIDASYKVIKATEGVVKDGDKVVVVIQTDGEENCSTEYTNADLALLIKEKQTAGWEFVYLGVDVDSYHQAGQMGIHVNNTINVSARDYGKTMQTISGMTMAYSRGQSMSMNFSPEDKARLEQEFVAAKNAGGFRPVPPPGVLVVHETPTKPPVVDDMDFTKEQEND